MCYFVDDTLSKFEIDLKLLFQILEIGVESIKDKSIERETIVWGNSMLKYISSNAVELLRVTLNKYINFKKHTEENLLQNKK